MAGQVKQVSALLRQLSAEDVRTVVDVIKALLAAEPFIVSYNGRHVMATHGPGTAELARAVLHGVSDLLEAEAKAAFVSGQGVH